MAVASRDARRSRNFAARFGAATAHGSYGGIVGDSNVDVVYVATTNESHRALAISGLEAGKAVLVEKPFTLDAAQAREVVEAARRTGRFCMEAMWMRFAPAFIELRRRLDDGEIGAVERIAASLGAAFAYERSSRLFAPGLGGGALLDLGVYPLSLCSALLGAPSRLSARAEIGRSGVDEEVAVEMSWPGGATATVAASLRRGLSNDATITGSRGTLHLGPPLYFPPSVARQEPAAHSPRESARRDRWGLSRWRRLAGMFGVPGVASGYQYEAAEVMRCVAEGRTESDGMPLDESVRVMEMLDAARAAWSAP